MVSRPRGRRPWSRLVVAVASLVVRFRTLTGELLAVVDQTMQPTRTSLWLRPRRFTPSG
jgi:hypothetical protein